MSILHVAIFRWNDGVTDQQIDAFTDALIALRAKMPMLLSYRFGRDLGLREGNFAYGVVAELESAAMVHEYLDHELHQEFIRSFVVAFDPAPRAVQIENVAGR